MIHLDGHRFQYDIHKKQVYNVRENRINTMNFELFIHGPWNCKSL